MTHPISLSNAADSVLIVVDIQPTLTAAMPENDAEQMLANTIVLLQAAAALEIPVLLTEQYPKGLGETEASIMESAPASTTKYQKTGFSCCAAEGFRGTLEKIGRKQLILVGQEAHVCILQTAFELKTQGYSVFVAEDSVCSRKQEHRYFALQRMAIAGITITNYESVLFEWMRASTHPKFKELAKLIR